MRVSTSDRRRGVLKGAFYHWFPSKDALIAAVAERSAYEQLAVVEDALARWATRSRLHGLAIDRILGLPDSSMSVLTRDQVESMVAALPRKLLSCAAAMSAPRTSRRDWWGPTRSAGRRAPLSSPGGHT